VPPSHAPAGHRWLSVKEAEDGSANKLSVIVDAARYQSSDLHNKIGPEAVSIFLIERISLTADNGPGGFEHSPERNIVEFSVPSLSSHAALVIARPTVLTPKARSGFNSCLGAFPRWPVVVVRGDAQSAHVPRW
jgi:hypothetical protein